MKEGKKMNTPKYSIIVPVYNAETYLPDAIESVLSQDFNDWELILINDGSIDKSQTICEYYQKQDQRIKLISKNNEGVSVTRNIGLESAKGEFIVFLDADDWLEKVFLKTANQIVNETDVDLLVLNYNEVNGTCEKRGTAISESLCSGVHNNKKDLIDFTLELASGDCLDWYGLMRPVWAKVFKRRFLVEHNIRFDEKLKYGEDAAFLLKYLTVVEKIAYRNEYVYFYRNNILSAMNNKKWEGSTHGEHYFSVVEQTIKDNASDISLAKFWFNIVENDWKVLEKEELPYLNKRNTIKNLFSTELYKRFSKKSIAKSLNKKQRIEAFLIRNKLCDILVLMYHILKNRTKKEYVYVHFFSEQNYGDDAFVWMLANRYPNISFIISGSKNNLRAFKDAKNIIVHNNNEILLKINRVIKKLTKKDTLYYMRAYKCKICLTIGGSIFIEPPQINLHTYLRDKKCKYYPKRKNVILGANFGPYQSDLFVDFFKSEFQRYNLVTFRDRKSYAIFKDIHLVKYAPDILFGLESFYKEADASQYTKEEYVVISVINATDEKELYIDKIVELIHYYMSINLKCVLLSLCHNQGDYDFCDRINEKSGGKTEILDYDGNIQIVMQCIKNAKYVIASRFHAIITSLVFEVPCLPVIYSDKTSNMLNDIEFNGMRCNIDDLKEMSVEEIDLNRKRNYIVDLEKAKEESKEHFKEFDKCLY